MYYWQICSPIQWVVFIDGFLCCAETLLFVVVPFVYFFSFVFLAHGNISEKNLLQELSEILVPMFSSRICMVLSLTIKSLIHFVFIIVYCLRRWSNFIFWIHLSNFPSTIYWVDYLYTTVCFCLFCQILIDHKGMDLFLGFPSVPFDWIICLYVCFYASTMLFWLLCPCSTVWYQVL